MIELYQELIPFSNNKNPNAVSQNGTLLNPIIMPLSLDVTSIYTSVEAVIYIRNNDPTKYYKNVIVSFMAPERFLDTSRMTDQHGNKCVNEPFDIKTVYYDPSISTLNFVDIDNTNRAALAAEYASEMIPSNVINRNVVIDNASWFDGSLNSSFLPCSNEIINTGVVKSAKLSYGYDEVSFSNWENKTTILVIPTIGNVSTPDTSYIPIRIKLDIHQNSTILSTLTDYAINVSYEQELSVGNL